MKRRFPWLLAIVGLLYFVGPALPPWRGGVAAHGNVKLMDRHQVYTNDDGSTEVDQWKQQEWWCSVDGHRSYLVRRELGRGGCKPTSGQSVRYLDLWFADTLLVKDGCVWVHAYDIMHRGSPRHSSLVTGHWSLVTEVQHTRHAQEISLTISTGDAL